MRYGFQSVLQSFPNPSVLAPTLKLQRKLADILPIGRQAPLAHRSFSEDGSVLAPTLKLQRKLVDISPSRRDAYAHAIYPSAFQASPLNGEK